jgi:hypothetical protein
MTDVDLATSYPGRVCVPCRGLLVRDHRFDQARRHDGDSELEVLVRERLERDREVVIQELHVHPAVSERSHRLILKGADGTNR